MHPQNSSYYSIPNLSMPDYSFYSIDYAIFSVDITRFIKVLLFFINKIFLGTQAQ